MKLMYLETFRQVEQVSQVAALEAQLLISEEDNGWQLMWTNIDERSSEQVEVWYEGESWTALQEHFFVHLYVKLEQGFAPLYALHQHGEERELNSKNDILQYYSEEHYDQILFEQLREWRKKESLKRKVPLYVIATNMMLKQLSTFIPYTNEELASITGLGAQRIQEYGTAILELTNAIPRTTCFPLSWVTEQCDELAYRRWKLMNSLSRQRIKGTRQALNIKLIEMVNANVRLVDISDQLRLSTYQVLRMLEQSIGQGEVEGMIAWIQAEKEGIPDEQYDIICGVYEKSDTSYLKPIMEEVKSLIDSSIKEEQIYDRLHILKLEKKLKIS